MNLDDLFPDDEIVSAAIDDEATPDERARVEGDADLGRRGEAFKEVRAKMAEPIVPPLGSMDAAVGAALAEHAALQAATTGAAATAAPTTVVDLDHRRLRRRAAIAAVAAAAVIVVALPIALSRANRTTTVEDAAVAVSGVSTESSVQDPASVGADKAGGSDASERNLADSEATTGVAEASAEDAAQAPPAGTGTPTVEDLGALDGESDLVRAVGTPTTSAPIASTTSSVGATPFSLTDACLDVAERSAPSGAVLSRTAAATYQGVPAFVLVFDEPAVGTTAAGRWVVVVRQSDCSILLSRSL